MNRIFTGKRLAYLYKITLPILALTALLILITLGADYFRPSRQPLTIFILNILIWLIFTTDFTIRIFLSEDGKHFVTSHIAEFIAIIPATPLLLLATELVNIHMQDLAKNLFEIIFVIKFFAYLIRAFTTQRRLIRTNPLHYAAAVTMTALVVAAVLFSNLEGRSYADSIWWAFVTASTTGFGDIVPATQGGRIVGIFLMVIGVSCISMLTGAIAIRLMYAGDKLPKKENAIIKNTIIELTHFSDLSAEDVDFICTTLKRMKKNQDLSERDLLEKKHGSKNISSDSRFIKWATRTFMSDPKDDLLIEEKLAETEDSTELKEKHSDDSKS